MSRPRSRAPHLLVLVLLLGACLVAAPGVSASGAPTASISGTFAGAGPRPSDIRISYGGDATVSPDAQGRYRIGGLEPGTYQLTVKSVDVTYFERSVTVAEGQQVTGVDFAYGAISGTLTGDGEPLANASVDVKGVTGRQFDDLVVQTDARGRYTAGFLPAGTYQLEFSRGEQWRTQWWRSKPTQAASDAVTVRTDRVAVADDVLRRTGSSRVSGTVRFPRGMKPGGDVVARDSRGRVAGYVELTSTTYELYLLRAGRYTLEFNRRGADRFAGEYYRDVKETRGRRAAARLTVALGTDRTLKPVTFSRGGVLAGRIVSPSGAPRAGVAVTAYDQADGHTTRTARTDRDGRYRITGLSAGRYTLRALRHRPSDNAVVRSYWPRSSATKAGSSMISVRTTGTRKPRTLVLR